MKCPYCNSLARRDDGRAVYGTKQFGYVYVCGRYPLCDAYVGCHRKTGKPKGTLANAELREWRAKAHRAFDEIWKTNQMARGDSYAWLAAQLNIHPDACHIGLMDVALCQRVIAVCLNRMYAKAKPFG